MKRYSRIVPHIALFFGIMCVAFGTVVVAEDEWEPAVANHQCDPTGTFCPNPCSGATPGTPCGPQTLLGDACSNAKEHHDCFPSDINCIPATITKKLGFWQPCGDYMFGTCSTGKCTGTVVGTCSRRVCKNS